MRLTSGRHLGWEVEASDSSPSKAATARREGSALSNEEMIASLQSIDSEGAVTPRETKQGDALVHTASARRWRDVRNVVAATQAFQAVTKQHEGRPDGKDRRLRHHNLLHVPAKLSAELDVLAAVRCRRSLDADEDHIPDALNPARDVGAARYPLLLRA